MRALAESRIREARFPVCTSAARASRPLPTSCPAHHSGLKPDLIKPAGSIRVQSRPALAPALKRIRGGESSRSGRAAPGKCITSQMWRWPEWRGHGEKQKASRVVETVRPSKSNTWQIGGLWRNDSLLTRAETLFFGRPGEKKLSMKLSTKRPNWTETDLLTVSTGCRRHPLNRSCFTYEKPSFRGGAVGETRTRALRFRKPFDLPMRIEKTVQ